MSDATQVFSLTVPAGNGANTVTTFLTPLGESVVQRILVTFPPGCSSLVDMAIFAGGGRAFPIQAAVFMGFDNYTYAQEVSGQITSGQWEIHARNRDFNQHILQVVYEYNYLTQPPTVPFEPALSL